VSGESVVCYFCKKLCDQPEELQRAYVNPKNGRVCVCNHCGGYEHCPQCGQLWENLHRPVGAICLRCTIYVHPHETKQS
jgi:hypothetical protein